MVILHFIVYSIWYLSCLVPVRLHEHLVFIFRLPELKKYAVALKKLSDDDLLHQIFDHYDELDEHGYRKCVAYCYHAAQREAHSRGILSRY